MAELPALKALVKRLRDKPFALIGINSDGPAPRIRKRLEQNGITWRQAIDGNTRGPLASRWNVRSWPTIYVLDGNGIIRHRNVRGAALAEAVDKLLAEMEDRKNEY